MTDLRTALTEIAERTPTYAVVDRALAQAGRRRTRRWWTGSVAAVVAVAGLGTGGLIAAAPADQAKPQPTVTPGPKTVAVPTHCESNELPVPPGYASSWVNGGDHTGRYVVGGATRGGHSVGLIWDAGVPSVADLPGDQDQLQDVNTAGLAVGRSTLNNHVVAWAVQDGVVSRLKGTDASAAGVDPRGRIVGWVDHKPAVWDSVTAQPRFLPVPSGVRGGSATSIDDDGTILGNLTVGSAATSTYVWRGTGVPTPLPAPDIGLGPQTSSFAGRLRGGWTVGSVTYGSQGRPAVWNVRTGEAHIIEVVGYPTAVNARGWILGQTATAYYLNVGQKRIELALPGPADDSSVAADLVSDDGTVVASEYREPAGQQLSHALLWRCS